MRGGWYRVFSRKQCNDIYSQWFCKCLRIERSLRIAQTTNDLNRNTILSDGQLFVRLCRSVFRTVWFAAAFRWVAHWTIFNNRSKSWGKEENYDQKDDSYCHMEFWGPHRQYIKRSNILFRSNQNKLCQVIPLLFSSIKGYASMKGPFFDASLIWGPLTGRMIYAGLRLGV